MKISIINYHFRFTKALNILTPLIFFVEFSFVYPSKHSSLDLINLKLHRRFLSIKFMANEPMPTIDSVFQTFKACKACLHKPSLCAHTAIFHLQDGTRGYQLPSSTEKVSTWCLEGFDGLLILKSALKCPNLSSQLLIAQGFYDKNRNSWY